MNNTNEQLKKIDKLPLTEKQRKDKGYEKHFLLNSDTAKLNEIIDTLNQLIEDSCPVNCQKCGYPSETGRVKINTEDSRQSEEDIMYICVGEEKRMVITPSHFRKIKDADEIKLVFKFNGTEEVIDVKEGLG